jgi:hypothetical protein
MNDIVALADPSGGLKPEQDLLFAEPPADPELRESVSIWLYEENGAFGFPRLALEAMGPDWFSRDVQCNFAEADGRVRLAYGKGPAPATLGPDGRPTVFGGGPLTFQCLEPFRRWRTTFEGEVADLHVADQIAMAVNPTHRSQIRLDVDLTMVTPAWVQGALLQAAAERLGEVEGRFMGGFRYEHLFRAEGTYVVDGEARPFRGTGLRVHRQGVRHLEGFWGHCWQTAVFPSGRAFGVLAYPPRPDGSESYNEGFLFEGDRLIPARLVKAPWLTGLVGAGEDVTLELESELGRTVIEAESALSTFVVGHPLMNGMSLQQAGARYRWNGETAYGMMERSAKVAL